MTLGITKKQPMKHKMQQVVAMQQQTDCQSSITLSRYTVEKLLQRKQAVSTHTAQEKIFLLLKTFYQVHFTGLQIGQVQL